jgi:hypothetical protein
VRVHRIRFRVPDGWLHADHGREQRFENGMNQISLADLGPATPDGFARTLREAQTLFERNQWEDARTLLDASNPRRFFASQARWRSVEDAWKMVTRIRRDETEGANGAVGADVDWEVRGAFHDLLIQVSALPQPDLESLATSELHALGHDSLRDIASQEAMAISGRAAIRIETWDRLSHRGRRSHLFVLSKGRLLCLRTELGREELLAAAFDGLVKSLEIEFDHGTEGV